jgi:hypothetical protein
MRSATSVEDVLAVQRELTSVRGEIESIQGRLNFFDEAAAYASIRVEVLPRALSPIASQQLGWNPANTAENALGTLVQVLQFLADGLIVLLVIGLPLALVVGIPGLILWRRRRRSGTLQPASD